MLRVVVLLLLVALPSGSDTRMAANNFAAVYNEWVEELKSGKPGTISAREIRLWNETRRQWKILDKTIHYQ